MFGLVKKSTLNVAETEIKDLQDIVKIKTKIVDQLDKRNGSLVSTNNILQERINGVENENIVLKAKLATIDIEEGERKIAEAKKKQAMTKKYKEPETEPETKRTTVRVTDKIIDEMKRLKKEGWNNRAIAKAVGVSSGTVSKYTKKAKKK